MADYGAFQPFIAVYIVFYALTSPFISSEGGNYPLFHQFLGRETTRLS